jgi:hypothetical protein
MAKQWINSKGEYYYSDIPVVTDNLPVGVYELDFNGFTKEFFLKKVSDKFEMPDKIYGIEKGLTDRIVTTYKRLDKNFGVLLKGLKGTGKTVTAKEVCNLLKLPVILVNKSWADMGSFINSIAQDVILFFDEFEKTYELTSYYDEDDEPENGKRSVNSLLTLMDGVFTSTHKRLFLLTTNKVYLPDAMISRPSRIRYIKEFGDLDYDNIIEILNDLVEDKKLIPDLVEILKELEVITVDIVKSAAEEANIYGVASKEFFSIFNVSRDVEKYNLVEFDKKGGETLVLEDCDIRFDGYYLGGNINIKKANIFGTIEDIDYEERKFTIVEKKTNKKREFALVKGKHIHSSMLQHVF